MDGDRSALVLPAMLVLWIAGIGYALTTWSSSEPPRVIETFDPPRVFELVEGSYTLLQFDPESAEVIDTFEYTLDAYWSWSYADARVEVDGETYLRGVSGTLAGWHLPESEGVRVTPLMHPAKPTHPPSPSPSPTEAMSP